MDALLEDGTDGRLWAHVDACPDCRALVRRQRTARQILARHVTAPAVPTDVSARWLKALAGESARQNTPAGPLDDGPPDFGGWPRLASPADSAPGDGSPPPSGTAGAPGRGPRPAGRHSQGPGRPRRVRIAVALAAGLTILIGAGAATWTTMDAQDEPASTAAAVDAPTAAMAGDADTGSASGAERAGAPEPEASPGPGDGFTSSMMPGGAAEGLMFTPAQVRSWVSAGEVRWAPPVPDHAAGARARACLASLGIGQPVLAARPASAAGRPVQLIVTQEAGLWRVTTVDPACPGGDGQVDAVLVRP